ncbi:MAG TPA: exosortase N [Leptospiraceae bacterium]|nr:exosortase N [Leptospiraceae bacterium]
MRIRDESQSVSVMKMRGESRLDRLMQGHPQTWLTITAILSLVPFLGTAYALFGGAPQSYLSLYPIGFLILFRSQKVRHRWLPLLFVALSILITLSGILTNRLSMIWVGSFWSFLGVCNLYGVPFAFPAPLLVFAAPPLAAFTSLLGGFSLRLWLTARAVQILSLLDVTATAQGNVIQFRGNQFSVDRVCEGMKMAVATALIAMVLARFSDRRGRLAIFLLAVPLWLGANLIRIICLAIFHVPASSASHELIGLVLFAALVVFPLMLMALLFPVQIQDTRPQLPFPNPLFGPLSRFVLPIVFILLSAGFLLYERRPLPFAWPESVGISARLTSGDRKFLLQQSSVGGDSRFAVYGLGDSSLILKRDLFAPGTAHDPHICFEAAGFAFQGETEETIGDIRLKSALVQKDGKSARLFWWYSWNTKRSSSDLEWRVARLRGEDVIQFNLYGFDDAALRNAAQMLLKSEI